MTTSKTQRHRSQAVQRRSLLWIGLWALLLSLLTPIASPQATDASQKRTSQQEQCDEGFVFNEGTGKCELITIPAQIQAPPDCKEGTVLNERTGECEPETPDDVQRVPDACPEGEQRHEVTGDCIPIEIGDPPLVRECPQGTALNQRTGQCEQEAPAQPSPTETPMLGEPPQDPPDPEHTLTIAKRICPADVNPGLSPAILANLCPVASDIEFTLTFGAGATSTSATDVNGVVSWNGIPAGDFAVQETDYELYGQPNILCWYQGVGLPFEVHALDGHIEGDMEDGVEFVCSWINFEDDGLNSVTVRKSNCPLGAPYEELGVDLIDVCTDFQADIEFTISWDGYSDTLSTAENGEVYWSGVPVGSISVQEAIPDGYLDPFVFCRNVSPGPGLPVAWTALGQVAGGLLEWEMPEPRVNLECVWLNIPDDQHESRIVVVKLNCPAGAVFEPEMEGGEVPLAAYQDACTEVGSDIEFTLDNADGSSTKSTNPGGIVVWHDVPYGPFTITETMPAGYDEDVWYCAHNLWEGNAVTPGVFEWVNASDGVHAASIEPGIIYNCQVFNISGDGNDDGGNMLRARKYFCPAGTDQSLPLDELEDTCSIATNAPVTFTLSHGGMSFDQTPNEHGTMQWNDVPSTEWSLQEAIMPGFGEPKVFCAFEGEGPAENVTVIGGLIQGSFENAIPEYNCSWFNFPDDDSSVTVEKYICPDGDFGESLAAHIAACTEDGDGIEFTLDNNDGSSTKAINGGVATWNVVPQGPFTLTETIPQDWSEPTWFCGQNYVDEESGALVLGLAGPAEEAPDGVHTDSIDHANTDYFCKVYNFPDRDRTVTVHKWHCDPEVLPESEAFDGFQDWRDACTNPIGGVDFTLSDGNGDITKSTAGDGTATWYGTTQGNVSLTEGTPPGYFEPFVYCMLDARFDDGAAYAEGMMPYTVADGSVSKQLDYAEYAWVCHFFNIQKGPGEITIHKWTCPPGYNLNAGNADPTVDCTEVTDGVEFAFGEPAGPPSSRTTGDENPGEVYFGELDPGTYVVTEIVPDGIDYVFVWDCVGTDIAAVHPTPLSWGNVLNIDVAGGDSIVCHWYNVPDPERGSVTLYKYVCSTGTFVSPVYCEIYEFGATFELYQVDGNVSKGEGTTDAGGGYIWADLDEGAYSLTEISHVPCKITSTKVDSEGNAWVDAGEETVIRAYNCAPGVPGGEIPGEYPDTGAGPTGHHAPNLANQPEGTATPVVGITSEEFYEVSCLNDDGSASSSTPAPSADDSDATAPPIELESTIDSTSPVGTPALDETAGCERGPIPIHLLVNDASIDAEIEVVEIVDGVMLAPSDPHVAAWYKETAHPGESNNMLVAGHLNWVNVPEGVFFHLADLEEGDRVEVTGDNGNTYVYEVQWARQESNSEPPALDVVGPTTEPSLTLITCGGEWDASIAEYDERTVVRAIQVDVITPDEEPDDTALRLDA